MSFRWWSKYSQKVLGKWKPFQQRNWKYYPVPGCMGHCEIVGTRRGKILFNHFVKRPQASHGLYWRSHNNEYIAFLKHIKAR